MILNIAFLSLLTIEQNKSRIIVILSIAVVTLLILLVMNLYKVYKLKTRLKSFETK